MRTINQVFPAGAPTAAPRSRAARLVAALIWLAVPVVAVSGGDVLAHSFNVGLVAPTSGPEAAAGRDAHDGLLLATRERDSHAGEESDGHLGGLDSYISTIDSRADGLAARVRDAVAERDLDILTIVAAPGERAALEGTGAVLCLSGRGPVRIGADNPATNRFVATFEAAFGRAPGPAAAAGYNAGRAIDRAVRAQGGVDDRAALVKDCGKAE